MHFATLDKKIFFLINHSASNAFFDLLMPALTEKGYLLLVPYLAYIIWKGYVNKNNKENDNLNLKKAFIAIFIAFCSFLLSDWLAYELKNIIAKPRPYGTLEGVRLLVGSTKSYSMPSNHASNSFAVALPLFYITRRYVHFVWRAYPLILASLIALSRAYVGVHYPSDIIFGAAFGSAVSILVLFSYEYSARAYKIKPYTTLLTASLAAISIFRIYYILHGPMDLSPDEAHYWEWSRRLDLSYYSKGPLIAYLIYIGTSIFGDSVFGIRIMAVLFSALSSIYVFKLASIMFEGQSSATGKRVALSSAVLLQVIPMFAPFGIIFTIDSPFIFFWTLSLYFFWKAANEATGIKEESAEYPTDNPKLPVNSSFAIKTWLLLGISIGLGLLTKYTMSFFYPCAFLFLLFSERRRLLKTVKPYAAFAVSLIVFSPVVIWNAQHGWLTVKHTAGQAHVADGINLSLITFLEFSGSQAGAVTPIIFVMMLYSIFKLQKSDKGLEPRFLLLFSMPVIGFFLLKSLQAKVQANWAMTGYIAGIIAVSRYYFSGRDFNVAGFSNRRILKPLTIAAVSLAFIVTAASHYPALLKLPPKMDPTSRLRGWKALGAEVGALYESMAGREHVLIFSDSYQVASELAFYVKGHPRTYSINLGRRMNQYDLWPDINSEAVSISRDSKKFSPDPVNGIFVKIGDAEMPLEVAGAFGRFEKKTLRVYENNMLLREYSIFVCYNFKGLKIEKPLTY